MSDPPSASEGVSCECSTEEFDSSPSESQLSEASDGPFADHSSALRTSNTQGKIKHAEEVGCTNTHNSGMWRIAGH